MTRNMVNAQGESSNVKSTRLFRSYQNEVEQHQLLAKKAERAQTHLLFVADAWRKLLADEYFVTLLYAEGQRTLPRYLHERIQNQKKMIGQNYGPEILDLVLVRGYLSKLLENQAITRYLRYCQTDVIAEFTAFVKAADLDKAQDEADPLRRNGQV